MIERRFFIPEKANDIFEIEYSGRFYFIGDFDNGKIYHDLSSKNHDLYYVEHGLMNADELEKYNEIKEMSEKEGDYT